MGNCTSRTQGLRLDDDEHPMIIKDVTETSTSEEQSTNQTNLLPPITFDESPLEISNASILVSSRASLSPSLSSYTPKSRAYQARIEKQKSMQLILSRSFDSHSVLTEDPSIDIITAVTPKTPHASKPPLAFTTDIPTQGPVLAVAIATPPLTLSLVTQPLLLALATPEHVILQQNNQQRILSHSRIKAMDWNDEACLSIAGDEGICYVYQCNNSTPTLLTQITRVDRITTVQFSKDSRFLAIGGFDGTVAILETQNYTIVAEIVLQGLVFTLDWSPDNRFLAIGDNKCSIVDVNSWNVVKEVPSQSSVYNVKWHPKGGRYLAIGTNSTIKIIDRNTYTVRKEISTSFRQKSLLAWSPTEGQYLAIGDEQVHVFETKRYNKIQTIEVDDLQSMTWGQEFPLNGAPTRYLLLGDQTQAHLYQTVAETSTSSGVSVTDHSIAESSMVSGRSEWVFREGAFLDVDDDLKPTSFSNGSVTSMAFSKGSRKHHSSFLAIASDSCSLYVYATQGWNALTQIPFEKRVSTIAFANGSRYIAVASDDSKVKIISTTPKVSVVATIELSTSISSLIFSRNNQKLALGCADGIVHLVNTDDWKVAGAIDTMASSILSMDWTTKFLAVACDDGYVGVYDSEAALRQDKTTIREFQFSAPVTAVAVGGSSRYLAIGRRDGVLEVYVTRSGWSRCHQSEIGSPVSCLDWCPNGRYLAVAGVERVAQVLDVAFWTEVASFQDEDADESSSLVSFSQNGKSLAVAIGSGSARVFDTTTWKELHCFDSEQHTKEGLPSVDELLNTSTMSVSEI